MLRPRPWTLTPRHSIASDALRTAILAIGTVHMRFCDDPGDQQGAWNIVRSANATVLSLVRRSIDEQEATGSLLEKSDVEMILASLLCCAVASVGGESDSGSRDGRLALTTESGSG